MKAQFNITIPATSQEMSSADVRKLINILFPVVILEKENTDVQYFQSIGVLIEIPDTEFQ